MIAEVARYLHQQIDAIEEWEDDKFLLYHAEIPGILQKEKPRERG